MRATTADGFSLIELLVALVVVSVLLGALVLGSGQSVDRELENAARRAELQVGEACERALATGLDVGFRVGERGLRFGYLRATGWQPLADDPADPLRPRELGRGLHLQGLRDGVPLDPAADPQAAHLACFASGELTPFELYLRPDSGAEGWRLRGRADGVLVLARESADAPR